MHSPHPFWCLSAKNKNPVLNYRFFSNQGITISASGFCATDQIQDLCQNHMHAPFYWIDLMEEPHLLINKDGVIGLNVDNTFNHGKSLTEIETLENNFVENFNQIGAVEICKKTKEHSGTKLRIKFKKEEYREIKNLETEKNIIDRLGGRYIALPLTDHDRMSLVENVDNIVLALKIPLTQKNINLHFHCRGGKGRATILVIMAWILKFYATKSYDEIISPLKNFHYEAKKLKQFNDFFQVFYFYCNDTQLQINWHTWVIEKLAPMLKNKTGNLLSIAHELVLQADPSDWYPKMDYLCHVLSNNLLQACPATSPPRHDSVF